MDPANKLIKELTKLPGIGEKSAARLAYHIMRAPKNDALSLAGAIVDIKEKIKFCSNCFNLTEMDPCRICSNPKRDHSIICVVEHPQDALAIEKTGAFRGAYHILHGVVSPLDGVGPDDVRIKELIERLKTSEVRELIIATNPTTEGEATSLYIARLASSYNLSISRIALGIPFGGDIEYVDKTTLSRSIELRSTLKKIS